jgi:hypothetical protein
MKKGFLVASFLAITGFLLMGPTTTKRTTTALGVAVLKTDMQGLNNPHYSSANSAATLKALKVVGQFVLDVTAGVTAYLVTKAVDGQQEVANRNAITEEIISKKIEAKMISL